MVGIQNKDIINLPLIGDYSLPYPVQSICYAHTTVHTFIDFVNEQGDRVPYTCLSRVSLTYRSSITTATTLKCNEYGIYIPPTDKHAPYTNCMHKMPCSRTLPTLIQATNDEVLLSSNIGSFGLPHSSPLPQQTLSLSSSARVGIPFGCTRAMNYDILHERVEVPNSTCITFLKFV